VLADVSDQAQVRALAALCLDGLRSLARGKRGAIWLRDGSVINLDDLDRDAIRVEYGRG
jgi:hypothetical protein